jgi:hypothetical protein
MKREIELMIPSQPKKEIAFLMILPRVWTGSGKCRVAAQTFLPPPY